MQSCCFVHKTSCVLYVPVAIAILHRALIVAFCLSRPIKPRFYRVYPRTSLTVVSIDSQQTNEYFLKLKIRV